MRIYERERERERERVGMTKSKLEGNCVKSRGVPARDFLDMVNIFTSLWIFVKSCSVTRQFKV
jgi:hypothetical protein